MSLRVTENYLAHIAVRDANRSLAEMIRQQRMAATLRRVSSYADDPIGVGAIQRYRSLISANDQYLRNLDRSRAFLEAADSALLNLSDILAETRALALQESSALGTPDSNAQAAEHVNSLTQRLLDTLNVMVEGNYIFGGFNTSAAPFIMSGDTVNYQGDSGEIRVQIGPHADIVVNTPGDVFLGTNNAILTGLVDVAPRLGLTDSLDDLNLGSGWEAGQFTVTDGTNTIHTIDLSNATTVADVINQVNLDSGGALTADLTADGSGLQITGSGPLTISEVDGGRTAQTLGLHGESDSGVFVGRDIRLSAAPTTLLTDIASLDDAFPLGEILIQIGEDEYRVDFAAATTIGDLQTILNTAVPELELQVEGAVLSVVGGGPASFTVSNGDGTNTATSLGLEGVGTPARLFGVMAELRDAMLANDSVAIRGTLAELAGVQEIILSETIKVGGRENTLDWMQGLLSQRDERLQSNLSHEWDADLARVATDLSKAEAAYNASLLVTSRLFEVNLMDYLR